MTLSSNNSWLANGSPPRALLPILVLVVGCSSSETPGSSDPDNRAGSGGETTNTGGQLGGGGVGNQGGSGVAGGGTSAGSGGSSGEPGTVTPPGLDQCPSPPDGASPAAVTALNTMNLVRLQMGVPCAEIALQLITAAENHCAYYALNAGTDCEAPSAHNEVDGCPLFSGESAGDRIASAGYEGRGWSEVMAFRNDPEAAVNGFINTVYHRTPVLSPWYRHHGYGGAVDCDTIDIARGPTTPDDATGVYPYANQTGVPPSFDGSREGPEPPAPPTGWPSGSPVTLYARDITVNTHQILLESSGEALEHVWEPDGDAQHFYTNTAFEPLTTYRVILEATRNSGEPLSFNHTFTTGEQQGRGGF